jgi:hypothetical protein
MSRDKFNRPPTDTFGPNKEFHIVWDLGPPRPIAPTRPVLNEEPGTPEHELERIEKWPVYSSALQTHVQEMKAFDDWHRAGPRKLKMDFVNAKHAVEADHDRYVFGHPSDTAAPVPAETKAPAEVDLTT